MVDVADHMRARRPGGRREEGLCLVFVPHATAAGTHHPADADPDVQVGFLLHPGRERFDPGLPLKTLPSRLGGGSAPPQRGASPLGGLHLPLVVPAKSSPFGALAGRLPLRPRRNKPPRTRPVRMKVVERLAFIFHALFPPRGLFPLLGALATAILACATSRATSPVAALSPRLPPAPPAPPRRANPAPIASPRKRKPPSASGRRLWFPRSSTWSSAARTTRSC